MSTLRQAAQQALEAFTDYANQYPHMQKGYMLDAEEALRAALAEPEPAPCTPQAAPGSAQAPQAQCNIAPDGVCESVECCKPDVPEAGCGNTEPVAFLWQHGESGRTRIAMPDQVLTVDAQWSLAGPLYLHPPQRKPLSDWAISKIYGDWAAIPGTSMADFARAIEAAHGIKGETK